MSAIIRNCHPTLAYECPRKWDKLVPTGRAAVRYCHTCSREVYLCEAPDEADRHVEKGLYVAQTVSDRFQQACR